MSLAEEYYKATGHCHPAHLEGYSPNATHQLYDLEEELRVWDQWCFKKYAPTVTTNKLIIKSNDIKEDENMMNNEIYDKMMNIYKKYMKIATEDLTTSNKTNTEPKAKTKAKDKIKTKLAIKRVIYYDNKITAVRWKDNSETIIRVQDGDHFSEETGLALCICKKLLGKSFYEEFGNIIDKAYRVDTKKRKADKKMKKELAKKRAEEERKKKEKAKEEKKVVNDKVVDNKEKTTKKKILIE